MPWSFFRGCPEFLGPLCGSPGCLGAFLGVSWPLGSLAGSTPAAWVPSGEHPGCLGPLCGSPGRPGLWVTAPPPRAVHLQHRGHQRFRGLREGGDRHPSQDAQAYPLREWHWEHWERIGRERGVLGGNWQALGWTGGLVFCCFGVLGFFCLVGFFLCLFLFVCVMLVSQAGILGASTSTGIREQWLEFAYPICSSKLLG